MTCRRQSLPQLAPPRRPPQYHISTERAAQGTGHQATSHTRPKQHQFQEATWRTRPKCSLYWKRRPERCGHAHARPHMPGHVIPTRPGRSDSRPQLCPSGKTPKRLKCGCTWGIHIEESTRVPRNVPEPCIFSAIDMVAERRATYVKSFRARRTPHMAMPRWPVTSTSPLTVSMYTTKITWTPRPIMGH